MNVAPIIAIPPLQEGAPAPATTAEPPPPSPPAVPPVAAIPAAEAARGSDPERRKSEDPPDRDRRDPPQEEELTDEEARARLAELRALDASIRAHEVAHLGALAQGLSADVGLGSNPQDTVRRMRQLRAAAMGPGEPSTQELQFAAAAARRESKALVELAALARETVQTRAKRHEHASGPCADCMNAIRAYLRHTDDALAVVSTRPLVETTM